ncbi:hypothetical protein BDV3_001222 [Batrachochytrium dendrobatidis]
MATVANPSFILISCNYNASIFKPLLLQPQHDMEQTLSAIIIELDLAQIHSLLGNIHSGLLAETTGSVRFALLLNFKRMILDAILKIWPLEKLQNCLSILHPMECVYMILNSTFVLSAADTDAIASLFGNDFIMAYTVFRYILLWINWKIHDPSQHDEWYYEAYFSDFSKDERKRVMSSIGSDILRYVETHPDEMLRTVVDSFKEIVPLLEGDHLIIFWKFFQKLQSNENVPMDASYTLDNFYSKLSSQQIRRCLLFQRPSLIHSPNMAYAIADTPFSATSPVVTDPDGWEMLCTSIHEYVGHRYEQSTALGDQTLQDAQDLITILFYPEADPFHQEISLMDKIVHFAPNPVKCIFSILNSSMITSQDQRTMLLRSFVLHWALFAFLRARGCRTLIDLDQANDYIVQEFGPSTLALHMDIDTYKALPILKSLAQWINELGATHPYTLPLSTLLKEAIAQGSLSACTPPPEAQPRSSLSIVHRSSTHYPTV